MYDQNMRIKSYIVLYQLTYLRCMMIFSVTLQISKILNKPGFCKNKKIERRNSSLLERFHLRSTPNSSLE